MLNCNSNINHKNGFRGMGRKFGKPFLSITMRDPTVRRPRKTDAVRKTHSELKKMFKELKANHVHKVFGKAVLVYCRTFDQLNDIVSKLRLVIQTNSAKEFGMPFEYRSSMKSLMIFIKPTEINLLEKIEYAFKQSINEYKVLIVDIGKENRSSSSSTSSESSAVNDSGDGSTCPSEVRDNKHIASKVHEPINVPQVQDSVNVPETTERKKTISEECFDAQEILQLIAILILFFTALSITN
jgi:hypothetical protein